MGRDVGSTTNLGALTTGAPVRQGGNYGTIPSSSAILPPGAGNPSIKSESALLIPQSSSSSGGPSSIMSVFSKGKTDETRMQAINVLITERDRLINEGGGGVKTAKKLHEIQSEIERQIGNLKDQSYSCRFDDAAPLKKINELREQGTPEALGKIALYEKCLNPADRAKHAVTVLKDLMARKSEIILENVEKFNKGEELAPSLPANTQNLKAVIQQRLDTEHINSRIHEEQEYLKDLPTDKSAKFNPQDDQIAALNKLKTGLTKSEKKTEVTGPRIDEGRQVALQLFLLNK